MEESLIKMVNHLKQLWNDSEVRVVVCIGACLQAFLFIHSFLRLRTKNNWFNYSASLASTSCYSIAAYGLGHMSSTLHNNTSSVPNELVVLWAPFFLFHLGGANVLTSLSVEDEYLWLKKSIYLVPYSLAVISIIIKSNPNKLLIATVFRFLLAIAWNSVMIVTLLFQKNEFLKDPYQARQGYLPVEGVHLKRLVAYIRNCILGLDQAVSGVSNLEIFPVESQLIWGGDLYNTFKAFIRTRSLSPQLRRLSRSIFTDSTPNRAFSLLDSEFYAMYRAFYLTKYVHSNTINFVVNACLYDSLSRINDLSDKLVRDLEICDMDLMITKCVFMSNLLHCGGYWLEEFRCLLRFPTWSESMCAINLVDWCLGASKFAALCGVEDVVDTIRLQFSISVKKIDDNAKQMIFDNIRDKSRLADDKGRAMEIGNLRGDGALLKYFMYEQLKWSLPDRDYGEGIILWHIATNLCFARDLPVSRTFKYSPYSSLLLFCETISEYMLYLIILEDKLMAPVVGQSSSVFKDTCSEAKKFFHDNSITVGEEARRRTLSEYNGMPQGIHREKSVLNDAIVLANRLLRVSYTFRWRLMSDVWIELLSYGAFHSPQRVHVEQPGQGGELISFVWLLMNHLGIGKQFWEEDAARPLHHHHD